VILNEFTLAAIISLEMTLVISAGGIDLSVGSAADIASLAFIGLVGAQQPFWLAVVAGLGGALLVGALNASLIAGVRISPLLATLSTLFISTSVQQLASNGGQPIYLISGTLPEAFTFSRTRAIVRCSGADLHRRSPGHDFLCDPAQE
jgi:ribose transport system permease protein